ncbi:MAG TPA: PhoH family protein [Firmicutes bacterium]|nr:PhoH family protein [Bacillota bacterium]
MTEKQVESKVFLQDTDEIFALLGKFDEHLSLLEDTFAARVIPRGDELLILGREEEVQAVTAFLKELLALIRRGHLLTTHEFAYGLKLARRGETGEIKNLFNDLIVVTERGKHVLPKTLGQKKYVESLRSHDIVFGIGPAGTGKTYLALAMAVSALKNKIVQRLVLTRPAVEAGEHLGFLPGDLQDKVDPYLRPLYDALYDLMGVEAFLKYREKGVIEVAPLAYMRGRTLDDSFIILDEAQNTTSEQMKMFLTRMGFGSRVVITGDITQIDLPRGKYSGLLEIVEILQNIEEISFVYLTDDDVVRHSLVQKIIQAYEQHSQKPGSRQDFIGKKEA